MEPIGDGTWRRVQLDSGQHYFFNTGTKESHWTAPPELEKILAEQPKKEAENIGSAGAKRKDVTTSHSNGDEKSGKKLKSENGTGLEFEEDHEEEEQEDEKEPSGAAGYLKISEEEHQQNIETFKEMLR